MSYLLGIDVGTTRTAAAISRSDGGRPGESEMVSLGDRSIDIPSVLFIGPDGTILVGESAERRALTDPDRVVREFKRRVGDPTPVVIAGRPWAPEELSARLVRWVVDRVAAREGGTAERIAVTHPASWGTHKKELFAGALSRVGLTVTFLAEPQAAALHYASAERVETGATIAVYDLGGGTFDAAVVRKDGGFGLLGRPEGIERLGGIDFDQVVFDHVMAGMPEAFADLDDSDPAVLAAVHRVRRECTEAKEALSSDTEVSVPVLLPGTQGSVRLHRSEFEQLILERIEETVAALRTAVASAGLGPEQLSAVLLVGGSSRIPLVAQLVSDQLGRPVAVDADPKNSIAKGAALALAPQSGSGGFPPVGRGAGATAGGYGGTGGHGAVGAAGLGAAGLGAAAAAAGGPGSGGPGTGGFGTTAAGSGGPGSAAPGSGGPGSGGSGSGGQASGGPGGGGPGTSGSGGFGGTPASGTGALFRPSGPPAPPPPPHGGAAGVAGAAAGAEPTPVTELLPTYGARGPAARPPAPPQEPTDYLDADQGSTRSPLLLVGVGAGLAVLAIVAAVVFWPKGGSIGDANTGGDQTSTTAPPAVTSAPNTLAPLDTATNHQPPPARTTAPPTQDSVQLPPPVIKTTQPPPVNTTTPPAPVTTTPPPPVTTTPAPSGAALPAATN